MMSARIIAQGRGEPPQLEDVPTPIFDLTGIPEITFCVCQGGMVSGEPSVIIASSSKAGTVMLQTSLDKFLMGASGMSSLATSLWGWKQQEGYASILPGLDKEQRKALLESIKRELEEWDDGSG